MLKIRLQKVGKKNAPSYRVVLAEHTAKPQGKFIEILGHYNPRLKQKGFKKERIEHWLSKGAQASSTVHNLLVDAKIIEAEKLRAWKPKKRSKAKSAEAPSEAKSEGGKEVPKIEEELKPEEKSEEKIESPEQPKEEVKEESKPEEEKEEEVDNTKKID